VDVDLMSPVGLVVVFKTCKQKKKKLRVSVVFKT